MTITLGWWVLPAAVTVASWAWAGRDKGYRGDYDFSGVFEFGAALIATLLVWLAYFIGVAIFA